MKLCYDIIVAIDGHSSCGKSTLAKDIAQALDYKYIDTGAMYRAMALFAIESGFIQNENIDFIKLENNLDNVIIQFLLNENSGKYETFLNGNNVEELIRSVEVANWVSPIAANKYVRRFLVKQQQNIGKDKCIVLDGRDIGTVVFPQAEIKIFLTANTEIRAKRRYNELLAKSDNVSLEEVKINIENRDRQDSNRKESPLRKAADAFEIDNSDLTRKEQLDVAMNRIIAEIGKKNNSLDVKIDSNSGFCFGVVQAINKAEEILKTENKLYCLGEIVHNDMEVTRLSQIGLETINYDQFKKLSDCKVLLRAHGEPPLTYEIAKKNNIELVDGTCPVVQRLQKRIKIDSENISNNERQIVILGKKNHPEVLGLEGNSNCQAIIIDYPENISSIDFNRPVSLYSQTTQNLDAFEKLERNLFDNFKKLGKNPDNYLEIHDTVCRQVSNRVPDIKEFALQNDIIFFVSGKKSSNGKLLFQISKSINPNSYFISNVSEIDTKVLKGYHSVGVCGATSTPQWLLAEVAKFVCTLKF